MRYLKNFKLYESSLEDEYLDRKPMAHKMDVLPDIIELLEWNFKFGISDDQLEVKLGELYDKGFEMGKLRSEDYFGYDEKIKGFRISEYLDKFTKELKPERISNKRYPKYNGLEITSYTILAADLNIQQMLDAIDNSERGYGDFKREYGDKSYIDELMREEDESEHEYYMDLYKYKEVEVICLKLFQIGFSFGHDYTRHHSVEEDLDTKIKKLFSKLKEGK